MWADNFWIMSRSKQNLEQMLRDLIDEASIHFQPDAVCCSQDSCDLLLLLRGRVSSHFVRLLCSGFLHASYL